MAFYYADFPICKDPHHSRSQQRTDQRILVLTLKSLALKMGFSPIKNTSKIFSDFPAISQKITNILKVFGDLKTPLLISCLNFTDYIICMCFLVTVTSKNFSHSSKACATSILVMGP